MAFKDDFVLVPKNHVNSLHSFPLMHLSHELSKEPFYSIYAPGRGDHLQTKLMEKNSLNQGQEMVLPFWWLLLGKFLV